MRLSNSNISFKRLLTPIEKIEARAVLTDTKSAIGLDKLAIVTHSVCFPTDKKEDIGIGILSDNAGANSYMNFLYDNAIDTLSIEPMGMIRGEFYSPYDATLLSKKQIVDLKALTTSAWANIFDIESFDEIVKNKDYQVVVPLDRSCTDFKTVQFEEDMVLYDYAIASCNKAMKEAYSNFLAKVEANDPRAIELNQEFEEFKKENNYYLKGDAIYSVLSKKYDTDSFASWANPLHRVLFDWEDDTFSNLEKQAEIESLERKYSKEIEFFKFYQFVVNKQQKDFASRVSKMSTERYEADLETTEQAYRKGEISKEKYVYLKAKIEEYKRNFQGVNIIGDKPVGYSDTDIFSNPSIFTKDEFMGAPPNFLKASKGQDWDFRFIPYDKMFNPDGSLASGGVFLKKAFKKVFEDNMGGVRIDHIIGLIDPWSYDNSPFKKTPLTSVSDCKVSQGSRHVFKYLLKNELSELNKFNLNEETIKGVIDPIQGIFDEKSLSRRFLVENGVSEFDEIKKVILAKKDDLDKIYSNVIEKIVLQSAIEVVKQRYEELGIIATEKEINKKARSLIICEDLGAITIPVKQMMKKYNLTGMRDASRSNPADENHYFREINPNEQGNFWLISTHDTDSYKNLFSSFDEEKRQAHISYISDEMGIKKENLMGNIFKYIQAKVARIFIGDKNPKTSNSVMLNWSDLFGVDKQYNTPGLYDKSKNWVLRIIKPSEDFEKRYYEKTLPSNNGINLFDAFYQATVSSNIKDEKLQDELQKLAAIVRE